VGVAQRQAHGWLTSIAERPIEPSAGAEEIKDALGRELTDEGRDAAAVVDHLATAIEPGLIAMGRRRALRRIR